MSSYISGMESERILEHLDRSTPFIFSGVSNSQLSIARHYGAINFQGQMYTYFPATDELIRDDVLKFVTKMRKKK
jgi:muramoyltetrapeptide carboxypeptidase LdcA involved in peptidoglycan recycling